MTETELKELAEQYALRIQKAGGVASKEDVEKVIVFFEKHINVPVAEVAYDRFNKALDNYWTRPTTPSLKAAVVESWKDVEYMASHAEKEVAQAEKPTAPAAVDPHELNTKLWVKRAIILFLIFLALMLGRYIFPHNPNAGKANGKLEKEVVSLKQELAAERAKPKGCTEAELREVSEKTAAECARQFQERLAGKKRNK